MYWAGECEVLEPEELIAMVVSDLKAVGRIYPQARTASSQGGPAADQRE